MDKTFLSVRELSDRLSVSEKTVYRMIRSKSIPFAIKISGQWRFNSEKIEKWISSSQLDNAAVERINHKIATGDALDNGVIIYRAHGESRDELLDEIFGMTGQISHADALNMKKQILYNESIVSSSLKGISCMLPENDGSWNVQKTMLLVAFTERPMNFKALDGVDTEVVFVLLAANKTEQMIIETKLTRLLMEDDFVSLLKKHPNRRDLLAQIATLEKSLMA